MNTANQSQPDGSRWHEESGAAPLPEASLSQIPPTRAQLRRSRRLISSGDVTVWTQFCALAVLCTWITTCDSADGRGKAIVPPRFAPAANSIAPSMTVLPLSAPPRAQLLAKTKLNSVVHAPATGRVAAPRNTSARATDKARPAARRVKPIDRPFIVLPTLKSRRMLAQAPSSIAPADVDSLPVAALPAAQQAPPALLATILPPQMLSTPPTGGSLPAGLPAMRKIITVSALKLPPASQPLPANLLAAAVSVDAFMPSLPTLNPRRRLANNRLAQNPALPPVRPAQPVTSSDRLPNQIEVAVSTFVVLLTTTDLQTVAVADPNIADVAVINSRAVLVNGKQAGVTSLVVVDRLKIRQYQVRVTAAPGTRPSDIQEQIGLPGVTVRSVRDSLVLEGEVNTSEDARRAAEVAGAYSTKVINQLTIRDVPNAAAGLSTQIQETINLPGVRVRMVNDTAFLDGTVENLGQLQRAQTVAGAIAKTVVNLLQLPTMTIDQARSAISGAEPTAQIMPGTFAPPLVKQVGDQIVLEGILPDQAQIDQAIATAQRTNLQVVNRLRLPSAAPGDLLGRSVEAAIGRPNIRVSGSVRRLILEGTVPDSNASVAAVQIARAYAAEVDNLLQVANPILINVDISIVEINKNNARNLGIQLGTASLLTENVAQTPATIVPGVPGTNGGAAIPPVVIPGSTQRTTTIDPTFRTGQFGLGASVTGAFRNLDPLRVQINALYNNGAARLLSNPKTTVISGRTATFQVGGQVPIPGLSTTGPSGTTTGIVFKDYGILLDVSPNANADGVVTMRVRAEVSAPDFATGVTQPGGGVIPGFTRRSTVTEVTIKPDGILALSGLVRNDVTRNISRVPILSRIPILGSLFTSKRFQREETELVIFVQPHVMTNLLLPGQTAPGGVVSADNTTNVGTVMGNPGITSFNNGAIFNTAGAGAAGGGAAQ